MGRKSTYWNQFIEFKKVEIKGMYILIPLLLRKEVLTTLLSFPNVYTFKDHITDRVSCRLFQCYYDSFHSSFSLLSSLPSVKDLYREEVESLQPIYPVN